MWASKLCRGVFTKPCCIKEPVYIRKPCSLPVYFSRTFSIKPESFRIFKLFNCSKSFNLLKRNAVTIASEAKTAAPNPKYVGAWLLGCSAMVCGAISLGGYTRLTESGLSMVTWNFAYEKFPFSNEDWEREFNKYQEYPEYKLLKHELTLSEFKKIWWTEYIHRNWGRMIGAAFLLPSVYFWVKGSLTPALKKRVVFLNSLVVLQGLMGWYMVKSGLENKFDGDSDIPRVSQYRLAAHLGMALLLFTSSIMTGLNLLHQGRALEVVHYNFKKIKIFAHSCKGMILFTSLSGALVAGLDAGLVHVAFPMPKKGESMIPDDILILDPVYRNFTENPTTVQFQHRVFGLTSSLLAHITGILCATSTLPRRVRIQGCIPLVISLLQIISGVMTVASNVDTSIALRHQFFALLYLTSTILLCHRLKYLKYVPK